MRLPAFYARENLTWRTMSCPHSPPGVNLPNRAAIPKRRRSCADSLAGKIANSFDQYLAFRPRMILDWERGKGKDWQALLWRELSRTAPGLHPPALAKEFTAAVGQGAALLPERVSVFGISTLPPFYMQFLQDLAEAIEVHLFVMRPTPEWWSDIRTEREELHARRRAPTTLQLDLQFARRNPLLASFGKVGPNFESVTELDPTEEHDRFEAPPNGSTTLAQIQRDIFKVHDPGSRAASGRGDGSSPLNSIPATARCARMEV